MSQPVELHRVFRALPDNVASSDPDQVFELARAYKDAVDWSTLLDRRCVVVLGEAGTGKTTEFQQQHDKLVSEGRHAFLVAIEELDNRELVATLDAVGQARYFQWQDDKDDGFFFLDSLDEAKLKGGSLKNALKNWDRAVGTHHEASHLFVSCRVCDWLSDTDLTAFREVIRRPEKVPDAELELWDPLVVQLAPLDDGQIRVLAGHLGVAALDDFVAALGASNAIDFAHRPQDIEWLGTYWTSHREIPSLKKLVDFNIREKVGEKPQRAPELSPDECRNGSKVLAGISVLTGHRFFGLPSGALSCAQNDAIRPQDVLATWSSSQIGELLTRPIFDEATYGRVRFHHRAVREYLAAHWLSSLLAAGLPRRQLDRALFPETQQGRLVPQHLAATAAWLSQMDDWVLHKMMEIGPEHLIDEGDPDGLPPEDRAAVLRAYVKKFQGRERVFHRFDRAGLGRFASPALSSTINSILADSTTGDDIKATLSRIVADGAIADCASACLQLALGANTSPIVRFTAVHAVGSAGTAEQRQALLRLLDQNAPIPGFDLAGALVRVLFPQDLSTSELMRLLRRLPRKSANLTTSFDVVLGHELPDSCTLEQRAELVTLFIAEATNNGAHDSPAGDRAWLVGPAAKLLASILDECDVDALPNGTAAALEFFKGRADFHDDQYLSQHNVREAVGRNEDVRRHLFWTEVQNKIGSTGRMPTRYWDVCDTARLFDLGPADTDWLANDALTYPDPLGRLLAFDTLLMLPAPKGAEQAYQRLLRTLAHSDQRLAKRWERAQRRRIESPHEVRLRRMGEARRLRRERRHKENKSALENILESLRAGDHFGALRHLHGVAAKGIGNRWGRIDIDGIRDVYGPEIADAASAGFKAYWRKLDPKLPHERVQPNETPVTNILGLAGVALDVEDGLDIATLPPKLKSVALRLAGWELNQLPSWLEALAQSDPVLVANALEPCIRAEYLDATAGVGGGDVLSKVPHSAPAILKALAPLLRRCLRTRHPGNMTALVDALEVVLVARSERFDAAFPKLARRRCNGAGTDGAVFAAWWVAWSEVDPKGAIAYLENRLKNARSSTAYRLISGVLGRLESWSESYSALTLQLSRQTYLLEKLILMTYPVVRPADDIDHEGVYTPGERDRAQDMRSRLVGWLADNRAQDSEAALRRLAAHPILVRQRDWLLHLADQAQAQRVASEPWSLQQALEWSSRFSRPPGAMRELFQTALDRLDDIKFWVEGGEFSPRDLFAAGGKNVQEAHFQNWIASELRRRSLRHYSVAREEEVGRQKKPDIRLHNQDCGARPVGIEVKIAEKWTYGELKKALIHQLVGQYLTDIESNHGILLLCSFGDERKAWRPKGKWNRSFFRVVEELRAEAKSVLESRTDLEQLAIVGIDFH